MFSFFSHFEEGSYSTLCLLSRLQCVILSHGTGLHLYCPPYLLYIGGWVVLEYNISLGKSTILSEIQIQEWAQELNMYCLVSGGAPLLMMHCGILWMHIRYANSHNTFGKQNYYIADHTENNDGFQISRQEWSKWMTWEKTNHRQEVK